MSDTQRNPSDVAMERFVEQKLTRREALRKMGITSGTALLMFIGVDNLARLTADKMREHEATREIGETVAREFRSVGAAWADTPYSGPSAPPFPSGPSVSPCESCGTYLNTLMTNCQAKYSNYISTYCLPITDPVLLKACTDYAQSLHDKCKRCANSAYNACLDKHGCPQEKLKPEMSPSDDCSTSSW